MSDVHNNHKPAKVLVAYETFWTDNDYVLPQQFRQQHR